MKSKNNTPANIFNKIYSNVFNYSETKILYVITFIGFLLRFVYLIESQSVPFFDRLYDLQLLYDKAAKLIALDKNFLGPEYFTISPLYTYFLSFFYLIFSKQIFLIQLIQIIISTLTIPVLYLVGKNLHSDKVGYIAAFLAAFFGNFIFYSTAILEVTLQIFLISVLMFFITQDFEKHIEKKWFLIGLFLALAAFTREALLVFAPIAFIWLLVKGRTYEKIKAQFSKVLVAYVLGLSILVVPFIIRNISESDSLILITPTEGLNFYMGNNSANSDVFVNPEGFNYYEDMAGINYLRATEKKDFLPGEASMKWFGKGLDFMLGNPIDAFFLTAKKAFLILGENENPEASSTDYEFYRETYSNILKLPLASFYFLVLFSLAGLTFLWNNKKRFSLLYWFIATIMIMLSFFYVSGRTRMILSPMLIVLSSYGLYNIFQIIRNGNYKVLISPGLLILGFVLFQSFLIPKYNFQRYMAYFDLGDYFTQVKSYDVAASSYKKSIMFREHYLTHLKLGDVYALQKMNAEALQEYKAVLELRPDYPPAIFNMALIYSSTGNLERATQLYERVLQVDPNYSDAYRSLGAIAYLNNDLSEALRYFEKFLETSTDEFAKNKILGDIALIRSKLSGR
ncbi:MAG: glycosyltransferase family 39 protein [Bacteroidetes bacterium]|nr:glycosyltransferase family 39 protein [Bacteroidota bacterium]